MSDDQSTSVDTQSVQDFLKAVYALQSETERISTNRLAEYLSITPPSVTDMAQRLHSAGLVDHRRYYGLRLTEIGEQLARKLTRQYHLIEAYLVHEFGYALDEAHEEADQMEHAVSEKFVEALTQRLGDREERPW